MSSITRGLPLNTPEGRRQSLARHHDKCRHFTGISSDAGGNMILGTDRRGECRAHVFYEDVRKRGSRMVSLPCFHPDPTNMPPDGEWPTCPHLSFKTPEEIDAETAETIRLVEEMTRRTSIVRPAIVAHANGRRGVQGDFP